ncbi:hypothetical protein ATCC90586_008054 [Pythium insidiosum]|nr:hypothetical protein ATCC90586_008054 [Pythium insidiosum]
MAADADVSLAELWAFVELVAAAPMDQLADAQARAALLLARRAPRAAAAVGDAAPTERGDPPVDAASDATLLCEQANERVARRMLERAASSHSSVAGSEDKSDTMSDCTTTTETSSVYGLQNTWVDLAMLYSLPFVAAEGSSASSSASATAMSTTGRLKAVPPLNVAQEQSNLQRVFLDSQRAVHTMRAVATIDSLRKVLDRGVTVLHFSGHGGRVAGKKNCLVFEDTQRTGLAHFIDAPTLRAIISDGVATSPASPDQLDTSQLVRHDSQSLDGDDGSQSASHAIANFAATRSVSSFSSFSRIGLSGTLKLVFVSSCHSREVGEVFVQAGVQHVVCVRSGDKILDDASAHFASSFYHALLAGKTIHQAFDTARVRVEADLQIPENEGNKFILLESSQVHADSCPLCSADDAPHVIEVNAATLELCSCHAGNAQFVFADISAGKWVDVSPTNRFAKTLPAIPESFVGREHELHMVAGLTTSQRFVTLRGPPGIGKSTLSIRLAHFLAERNVFPDGVAFIRLRGVQSLEGVETAIKSALYPDGGREKETPLHMLLADQKVLLVMDNMEDPINANPAATREFLVHLLQNTPNLAFLMTARQALGGGIAGFDEKVVSLNRLSHYHASDLFLRKSPRGLLLSEIGDIETQQTGKSHFKSLWGTKWESLVETLQRFSLLQRNQHVEKMDSQAEIMAVCVSYSTFPFITSYARGLLGLYDDDGAKNRTLESICAADRDLFVYNTARHFWKVSHWVFQHICTLAARSSASYLILDMHESNICPVDVDAEANKALHIAKVHKDTLSEANARKLMGILLTTETKFDEAKAQFGMALILYKAVGDKIGQAASLSAIGMIHSRKGNLRGAHNCFTKALTLYEWFKHALGQLNCHQRLANLEKKLRDGDGLRGKNAQSTGHSHHYAATRRLQGDLNRRRNGEYIVRWVGHEMSLLLELPAASSEKIQEVHAPSDASLAARSMNSIDTEGDGIGTSATSNVTNTPKKSRLEQIIDQRERERGNPPPLTLGLPHPAVANNEVLPERLKNSSFVRRKEYDATIRRHSAQHLHLG